MISKSHGCIVEDVSKLYHGLEPKLGVPNSSWKNKAWSMELRFLSRATLIEVTGIQENRIGSLSHDLILLVSKSGNTSVTGVLLSASRGVDVDLLEVGVDIIDVNNSQVKNILLLGWEAVSSPDE